MVLELGPAAGAGIEGTAIWPGVLEPIPFSGWLDLMRVIEAAQGHAGGSAATAGRTGPDRPDDAVRREVPRSRPSGETVAAAGRNQDDLRTGMDAGD